MNKYNIKIPDNITIIYSKKAKTITIIGLLTKKSIKLKLKIFVDQSKKSLNISPLAFKGVSNFKQKQNVAFRSSTLAKIKHMLVESCVLVHKKLKINGVGYKSFNSAKFRDQLLTLNLGFSHTVYVKIPKHLKIKCFAKTKLYVIGNSYEDVSGFSALIKSKKLPEPYKGKGILYDTETIVLKNGKKI